MMAQYVEDLEDAISYCISIITVFILVIALFEQVLASNRRCAEKSCHREGHRS